MRQKSGPVKEPAVKVVKDIRRATRRQFSAKRRSAWCWRACAARRASPSCAVVKGSSRICIAAGRKTSLRPGRSGSSAGEALWRLLLARQRAGNRLAAVE